MQGPRQTQIPKEPPPRGPLHPLVLWGRLRKDIPAVIGLILVALFVLIALFAPLIAPADPNATDLTRMNQAPAFLMPADSPDRVHAGFLGRDVRGRDVLSRVIHGTRTSLLIGVLVVMISSAIGVTLGSIAGYFGGLTDTIISRIVDILLAFPFLILALAIVSIFPRTSQWHMALALGLAGWPSMARLMRAQVLGTRELEFVSAARALGAGNLHILTRHVLPNCIGPAIIWVTMGIAGAIMAESSLAFLGLGEDDSLSWGTMINTGLTKANFPDQWWGVAFPALALALLVLAFNMLGDGLQDAINPRKRR
jgi:peptide/nickel transport system permease protein/oligopeptide transport system permease protein